MGDDIITPRGERMPLDEDPDDPTCVHGVAGPCAACDQMIFRDSQTDEPLDPKENECEA